MSTTHTVCKLQQYARQEGQADYLGRAEDVAVGCEPSEWAWPFSGADDAYISALGVTSICKSAGIHPGDWDSDSFCAAFREGYESAHEGGGL